MLQPARLLRTAIIGTVGTFSIRIGVAGAQFCLAVALARLLGVSGYGLYSFALTIASLLTIPAALGYPGYLVKKINEFLAKKVLLDLVAWFKGILTLTVGSSVIIAALGCAMVYFTIFPEQPAFAVALLIALAGLPVFVAHQIASMAIVAIGRPITGVFLEELLRPLLLLTALAPAFLIGVYNPDPKVTLILTVCSAAACLALALLLLRRWIPASPRQIDLARHTAFKPDFHEWRQMAFPFLLATSIAYLNHEVDTLMLGVMIDTDAVGLYRPATRIVGLASFMTVAVGRVMMPMIARLHTEGNIRDLSHVLTAAARISFLYAVVISALLALAAPHILRLFSDEFIPAADVIRILLVGVVFAAGVPTGYHLLAMTGFQALTARVFFASLVLNITLNFTLIPLFGIEGAAIATAFTAVFVSAFLWTLAYRKTHLDSSILGYAAPTRKRAATLDATSSTGC